MIGRKEELAVLQSLERSGRSAFVAVYGRHRIGKTYLIRHVFEGKFTFHITGIANVGLQAQLANFYAALVRHFPWTEDRPMPGNWFQAFQYLICTTPTSNARF